MAEKPKRLNSGVVTEAGSALSMVTVTIGDTEQKTASGGGTYTAYHVYITIQHPADYDERDYAKGLRTAPAGTSIPQPVKRRKSSVAPDAHPLLRDDSVNDSMARVQEYTVEKRYSELLAFHEDWRKRFPKIDSRSRRFNFPKKKWLFNMTPEFVHERQRDLNTYLSAVNAHPFLRKLLYSMLGCAHMVPDIMSEELPADHSRWAGSEDDDNHNRRINPHSHARSRAERQHSLLQQARKSRTAMMLAGGGTVKQSRSQESKDDDSDLPALLRPAPTRPKGYGPSPADAMSSSEWWTKTFVLSAIVDGRLDAVKAAVDAGFDVNSKLGYHEQSAIAWAQHTNNIAIADYLLEMGAAPPDTSYRRVVPPGARLINITRWKASGAPDSGDDSGDD